jgi:hypothetical protein
MEGIPLLLGSRPCWVVTILRQPHILTAGFSQYFLQLLAPGLDWLSAANLQLQLSILDWLPSWTNWLPAAELTHNAKLTPYVALEQTAQKTSLPTGTPLLHVCVRCLAMALVLLHVTRPLPSNGGFSGPTILALRKYATISFLVWW